MTYNREYFEQLDQQDPLAPFRDQFALNAGEIYLDGNSLGARPKKAAQRAVQVMEQEWGKDLIRSWNTHNWFELPYRIGDKIASLIGADKGEVVCTDATGINLYKAVATALKLAPKRKVVLMEGSNFPTNNYMIQGLVAQLGDGYEVRFAEDHEFAEKIDEDVAVVCLTQVHYKTGRLLDMQAITEQAQHKGCLVVWDLCHSAGALPVDLNAANADLAVGCTYKYLNGGPGSQAFIFVARRHQNKVNQPLSGWWGHSAPFNFERDYQPGEGISQMLTGTQGILGLAVTEVGIDVMCAADMQQIRAKSQALTRYFIELVEERCGQFDFTLVSPREDELRGSQVAFSHAQGYPIMQALIDAGVVGDFRAPDILRFGFAPLYNSYCDIWDAVERFHDIMLTERWKQPRFNQRHAVT
ncbi:kynureninase [Lacimicrobium alkaliphilum]|uniref:Kynureninase n=1 Tax=Lacimicrobium alkaliphilum TaxID=1526571 RepID=A0ABQ1R9R4_9ALTE|nr:kynureninase [Lacimicrobium alkaliphilum]GGD61287.1 kynureninase [Lacimicrobium alkaliphilum]